jgi:hypothetical protein
MISTFFEVVRGPAETENGYQSADIDGCGIVLDLKSGISEALDSLSLSLCRLVFPKHCEKGISVVANDGSHLPTEQIALCYIILGSRATRSGSDLGRIQCLTRVQVITWVTSTGAMDSCKAKPRLSMHTIPGSPTSYPSSPCHVLTSLPHNLYHNNGSPRADAL